jgi:hypothetical protein
VNLVLSVRARLLVSCLLAAGACTSTSADLAPGGAGGPGGGQAPAADPTAAPGHYVTDAATTGSATCAGQSLGDVLDAVRAAEPELAGVTALYDPAGQYVGDGSFIYAYLRSDGGFDVVFKLGFGDCPSGCTENDYRYFSTDGACAPAQVGRYHARWGLQSCLEVDGAPMWGNPSAPDPLIVCGADNHPQDLRGSYRLHAVGQQQACVASGDSGSPSAVDRVVTMTIDQDPSDLGAGTVTFTGTGHPLVDGVALPATVQRRRFDAALQSGNLPSVCPRTQSVTARYDLESYEPGGIDVYQAGNDACAACKGFMKLALSAASP